TSAASPSMPLRKSTGGIATSTRTLIGGTIMRPPSRHAAQPSTSSRLQHRERGSYYHADGDLDLSRLSPGSRLVAQLEVLAHLRTYHGFERLRLCGLSGARDEFHLAAVVQSLKTLALRLIRPPPLATRARVASVDGVTVEAEART